MSDQAAPMRPGDKDSKAVVFESGHAARSMRERSPSTLRGMLQTV
jgi:hypothetical protein